MLAVRSKRRCWARSLAVSKGWSGRSDTSKPGEGGRAPRPLRDRSRGNLRRPARKIWKNSAKNFAEIDCRYWGGWLVAGRRCSCSTEKGNRSRLKRQMQPQATNVRCAPSGAVHFATDVYHKPGLWLKCLLLEAKRKRPVGNTAQIGRE